VLPSSRGTGTGTGSRVASGPRKGRCDGMPQPRRSGMGLIPAGRGQEKFTYSGSICQSSKDGGWDLSPGIASHVPTARFEEQVLATFFCWFYTVPSRLYHTPIQSVCEQTAYEHATHLPEGRCSGISRGAASMYSEGSGTRFQTGAARCCT